jgi:hypothetical protein
LSWCPSTQPKVQVSGEVQILLQILVRRSNEAHWGSRGWPSKVCNNAWSPSKWQLMPPIFIHGVFKNTIYDTRDATKLGLVHGLFFGLSW